MVNAFIPQTLAEALAIRQNHPAVPLAGGTDLMVRKRSWAGTLPGFEQPVLLIGAVPGLREVNLRDGVLTIGAAATLASLAEHPAVPEILKRAVAEMASPAIRNTGTLGGNICNASPAADTLPPLYVLDATLVLESSRERGAGRRAVPVTEFITGPGRTVLRDDELLTAVQIPVENFQHEYYKKVGTRKADALSKASCAALAKTEGGVVTEVRIALGAVAPRVVRSKAAEEFLKGKEVAALPGLWPEIRKYYEPDIRPIDDQRSSAAYRSAVSFRLIEYFISQIS